MTRLEYDAQGHITRVFDPFGRHTRFSYDANGNMIEAVDMEGNAFQYTYDSLIRITQINTVQGPWKFYHEGPDGNSVSFYPAPGGDVGQHPIDGDRSDESEEYYYDGTSEETDYTCCGLPGVVKDRSGRKSYYDYDALKEVSAGSGRFGQHLADGLRRGRQHNAAHRCQRPGHALVL